VALGRRVEIKDGQFAACQPDQAGYHLLVDFDPTSKPKSVDLTVPGQKKIVLLGIYRLEDDVLSIAVSTADTRPETYMRPEDQVLLVMKRARN
jgi:uncharacterized protein (TIGR03067 family)